MNTNYSNIEDDYKELTTYLNEVYYSDGESSIQEHLFHMGLEYCADRPKFYTECECFWNYYIRQFYDKMFYILNAPVIKDRDGKVERLIRTYNATLEFPDFLRGEIFIEYQSNIDRKFNENKKSIQVSVKNKRIHLKEI